MQSTPSPAATAAAAAKVAALAVVVAKKRVAKLNGQLRNEAEKWEWWENDRRTKIRISKWAESNNDLEDRVVELEEDLKHEKEMASSYQSLYEAAERQHDLRRERPQRRQPASCWSSITSCTRPCTPR